MNEFLAIVLVLASGRPNTAAVPKPDTTIAPKPVTSVMAKPSRLFLRAPDVIPGTLPEMRETSYWTARMQHPDEVVLTPDRIQGMNDYFEQKMEHPERLDTGARHLIDGKLETSPGLFYVEIDLYRKTPSELSDIVRAMISKEIKYLRKGEYGNTLAIQYSAKELNDLEGEMAYDHIGAPLTVQSGITVADTRLRIIPALRPEYLGLSDKNRTRWDLWNLDVLPIGSPVQILHISKTGESLFVQSENGYGWVSSQDIALGARSVIGQFLHSGNFMVCTGDEVQLYANKDCRIASGLFRMGDRLPLGGTAAPGNHPVAAGGPRRPDNGPVLVQVPTRRMDGTLLIQQAWLASGADVHNGYLPYTRKNVVIQSFKLLDNIYDWTGAWLGRNHATALRDVFATFGFKLPSCGELMSVYNDKTRFVRPAEGKDRQIALMLSSDPFLTIQICSTGHSQLYLGNYNGVPILYDTHGYNYTDASGNDLDIRRSCIETIAFPNYFLKQDITFLELE